MKDETMDNQQVTPQYIAGIWDGEGTITITTTRIKKWVQYHAQVSVSNTDLRIIHAVRDYIESIDCNYYIREVRSKNKNCKIQYQLSLSNLRSRLIFLNSILPHLIAKKPQALLAIDFVQRRIRKINLNRRNRLGQYIGRERFDDYEGSLHKKIKGMNAKGESSETIRHPPDGDDIVRPTLKEVEIGRNDLSSQLILFN